MKLSQLALLALGTHGEEASYSAPSKPENFIFFETFDSPNALDGWTMSKDEKYDGMQLVKHTKYNNGWVQVVNGLSKSCQVVDLVAIVAWS